MRIMTKITKRFFDVIGAVAGLIFILPFTPFVALAIIFESGRPVFVKLDRVSKGKVIGVYKFRSMVLGAHKAKKNLAHMIMLLLALAAKFLRKFRLDEFPQFLNVLTGELSLVGPRPHEPEEIDQYPPKFKELYFAKSGLTGLSQVSGASALPYYKELELDLHYVKHRSLWLDLKILFRTVWIFFSDPTGV